MARKYHINRNGEPSLCEAIKTACPLVGAEHGEFESEKAARAWAEEVNFHRAGGERNLLGFKKRESPAEQAAEQFNTLTIASTYNTPEDIVALLSNRLGVLGHDVSVRSDPSRYSLREGEEVFVSNGDGKVRVYSYHMATTYRDARLEPAALIGGSEYAESTLEYFRSRETHADPKGALREAFFSGEITEHRSPSKGLVYGVFDGIEQRYFDGKLNDESSMVSWESATDTLRKIDHAADRRAAIESIKPDQSRALMSQLQNAIQASANARSKRTVASAKSANREKKPRQTLKWHAEQPVTEKERAVLDRVVTVEKIRELPDDAKMRMLYDHAERTRLSAQSMVESMRVSKNSEPGKSTIATSTDRGRFFDGNKQEIVSIYIDHETRMVTYNYTGGKSEQGGESNTRELFYLPSDAKVLQSIRTGNQDSLKQSLPETQRAR